MERFSASSNAYDSLAEALEAAGEQREAVAVTEKALEVLAKQELTPEQRRDMSELLEARLKRLSEATCSWSSRAAADCRLALPESSRCG